jgi:hypothetical protein
MIQRHVHEVSVYNNNNSNNDYSHEEEEYTATTADVYDVLHPKRNRHQIVTPDVVAYTSVIQAHGNSQVSVSAERVMSLLLEMIHSDIPSIEVDSFAFTSAINVFSKIAANQALSSRTRMEAVVKAEEIWWMYVEELKKKQHMETDMNDPDDHSATLLSMDSRNTTSNTSNRNDLTPSIVPFNAVLRAIAHQRCTKRTPFMARRYFAQTRFNGMEASSSRVDYTTYPTLSRHYFLPYGYAGMG